jgi:HAMP domain-containing protein
MSKDNLDRGRRSTRLSISIPIVISGVDALGQEFSESVRTLVVNKHGGKILTTRHLAMGAEVLIENRAVGAVAKAGVAWLSEKHSAGDLHHVGLQLLEAQNVWGIAFPPEDWSGEPAEEQRAGPGSPPAEEHAGATGAETRVSSLAGEEITIRALQELQKSTDAYVREFQDRLAQLSQRLGLELEFDLRGRAAGAKKGEVGALEEEIKVLRESLRAAREEMGKLEARIEELKSDLQAATGSAPPTPLQEARRQLAALSNSIVESMNRAAEAGLLEYRNLLQKENQESAARRRLEAEQNPPPPKGQASES